jgi:integrase/recombinase XerD
MANLKVALLLRAKTTNGNRPYLNPVMAGNGKIRPLWAVYKNQPTHFPDGVYYLRHKQGKRVVFEQVGSDLSVAQIELRRLKNLLEAKLLGNSVDKAEAPASRIRLDSAIELYLDDIAARRTLRTAKGYRYVLELFRKRCQREYLNELGRADMVAFIAKQKEQGISNRTICNQVANLDTFFRANGLPKLLANADRPEYTEKLVKAYSREELSRLLAAADPEDRIAFKFFVGTGCREREVQFACWSGVNFADATFTVKEKLDLGFSPKDKEEREIPLPDDLLEVLRERRKTNPTTRLIFTNGQGGPEGHFLRRLKKLALRASLNCGECVNKVGQSCREHPVCNRWELHAMRKTFATMHHDAGVSARTIQDWLGHSDLETTLRYLKVSDNRSAATRKQVNNTFGELFRPKPVLVA